MYLNVLQYKDNLETKREVKRNSNSIIYVNYNNNNKKKNDNNTNKATGGTVTTLESRIIGGVGIIGVVGLDIVIIIKK